MLLRTRIATGSLSGARPQTEILVPGVNPISRSRLPSSPLTFIALMTPLWFSFIFLNAKIFMGSHFYLLFFAFTI